MLSINSFVKMLSLKISKKILHCRRIYNIIKHRIMNLLIFLVDEEKLNFVVLQFNRWLI